MKSTSTLEQLLTEKLPRHLVVSDPASCAFYGRDWIRDFEPRASLVVLPESTAQVQDVVRVCAAQGVPIVPSGGRTGLSGGATATQGEVVLSLERMRGPVVVNRIDRTAVCQAGVPLERLQLAAAEHDLYFPVDFSSRGSAQVGGNIATNAGGVRVIRYGNFRDWVVGLTVVTGTGERLDLNGALFKNNTGYDLRALMIGSEGTLGIVTEATLRLTTPPRDTARALCGLSSNAQILPFLTLCRDTLAGLSAFEFMESSAFDEVIQRRGLRTPLTGSYPTYILLECELGACMTSTQLQEVLGDALEREIIADCVVSESCAQAKELMDIRDLIGETLAQHYTLHKNDISVPVDTIPRFVDELHTAVRGIYPDFKVVVFGHVGDGNLHVNVLKPAGLDDKEFWRRCHDADHAVFGLVQKFRGSISAEHGVGLLKRDFLSYSRTPLEVSLMRGIKQVFDPHGILNPGKIFPSCEEL